MTEKLTPRVRVFALVGALAAVALVVSMLVLGRSQPVSSAGPITLKPLAKPRPAAPVTKRATSAPKRPAVAPNGLPWAIADALKKSDVVVVSLVAPQPAVDGLASAEAAAGAKLARAAFVRVNVLSQAQARPLVAKFGVLKNPSVLVFTRSGEVNVRLDGFADRETVAQAAENAAQAAAVTAAAAAPAAVAAAAQ